MNPPDWLSRHDGAIRESTDGRTWFVYFDGAPHYKLAPEPADGQFACRLQQTENGKWIGKGTLYPNGDEALRGGLEELREFLGW
jgi:hypothetical protein